MSIGTLVEKVIPLLNPILAQAGLELFEIESSKAGPKHFFRIFISRPNGAVTLDDCQYVSQALDLKMEVEGLFPDNTILEVSSVGLDRPLKRQKDFQHFLGLKVKVKTFKPLENEKTFLGIISACDEKTVTLCLEGEKLINIPYENIAKARLEISF